MKEKIRDFVKSLYKNNDSVILNLAVGAYNKYKLSYSITFRHYNRQHKAMRKFLDLELSRILNFSTDFEMQSYVNKFEKKFSKLCDTRFAVGTNSGTAALQLSLTALGIGSGDEVITAPNSYIATALAIANTGARPVFVDVDEESFNIDTEKMENAITDKTKAIMPVHLYGQMADMNLILRLAKKYDLKVVEDACQAFGSDYHNKKAGSLGNAGCFSFYTSKNISGLGNGGMVVSNSKQLVGTLRTLCDPESNDAKLRLSMRTPCFLDAVQAAFLNAKLNHIGGWIRLRREKAKLYNELLQDTDVVVPKENANTRHAYCSYVIKSKRRDSLRKFLARKGIEMQVEYVLPVHMTKTFQYLGHKKGDFSVTEKLSETILSLPISPFLSDGEIEKISAEIKRFCSK